MVLILQNGDLTLFVEEAQLLEGFHVNVCWVEQQFLAAVGAFAIVTLNYFVRRGQFDTFIEHMSAFLACYALRHYTNSHLARNTIQSTYLNLAHPFFTRLRKTERKCENVEALFAATA
jgi:hypothetical protein